MSGAEAWTALGLICLAADLFFVALALATLSVKWITQKLTQKLEG